MSGKEYTDLKAGLLAHHIPSDNWAFVEKLVAGIDSAGIFDGGDHVIVRRKSGKSRLYVYYGYTNGFVSENEILDTVGEASHYPSDRGIDRWCVDHPVYGAGYGGGDQHTSSKRQAGFCPECFTQLPLSGLCDNCA